MTKKVKGVESNYPPIVVVADDDPDNTKSNLFNKIIGTLKADIHSIDLQIENTESLKTTIKGFSDNQDLRDILANILNLEKDFESIKARNLVSMGNWREVCSTPSALQLKTEADWTQVDKFMIGLERTIHETRDHLMKYIHNNSEKTVSFKTMFEETLTFIENNLNILISELLNFKNKLSILLVDLTVLHGVTQESLVFTNNYLRSALIGASIATAICLATLLVARNVETANFKKLDSILTEQTGVIETIKSEVAKVPYRFDEIKDRVEEIRNLGLAGISLTGLLAFRYIINIIRKR